MIAWLAQTYLRFGDRDAAAAEMVRFVQAAPGNRQTVRFDPRFAAFRDDPRVRRAIGS